MTCVLLRGRKNDGNGCSFFICSSSARCNSYLPHLYHFIILQLFEERSNYLQHGKCNLNKKHMREKTINVCKQPKKNPSNDKKHKKDQNEQDRSQKVIHKQKDHHENESLFGLKKL